MSKKNQSVKKEIASEKPIIKRAKKLTKKQKIIIGGVITGLIIIAGIIAGLIYNNHIKQQEEIAQQEQEKFDKKIELATDNIRYTKSSQEKINQVHKVLKENDNLSDGQKVDLLTQEFIAHKVNKDDTNLEQTLKQVLSLNLNCKDIGKLDVITDVAEYNKDFLKQLLEKDIKLYKSCIDSNQYPDTMSYLKYKEEWLEKLNQQ